MLAGVVDIRIHKRRYWRRDNGGSLVFATLDVVKTIVALYSPGARPQNDAVLTRLTTLFWGGDGFARRKTTTTCTFLSPFAHTTHVNTPALCLRVTQLSEMI